MKHYLRWMVGLDFSAMDQTVISYTSYLANIFHPEKIYFIHVADDMEIPQELKDAFPEFRQPRDEVLKAEMQAQVSEALSPSEGLQLDFKVVEGSPQTEFLRWAKIKDADLLILGRKKEIDGGGLIPTQIARKALSSVLFVPEAPRHQLKNIWVSTDFSPHSAQALFQAMSMAQEASQETNVYVQHVYEVPSGYYKTGKTEEKFAQIMLGFAEKRYQQFLESIPGSHYSCKPVFSYDPYKTSPAKLILEKARARESDLIVLGARGRNIVTALLLGSVAEKLIRLNSDIPMLLIKRSDKVMEFTDLIDIL